MDIIRIVLELLYWNFGGKMGKKITITGAGGYIGRDVVNAFLNKNIPVTAVDINTNFIDNRASIVECNIFEDKGDIYKKINEPEICLHLAWQDGFNHNAQSHIMNIPKHYTFINNMIENGLKQIVVLGTMHEVGYWEGAIDENTPTNPISFYGIGKNTVRQIVQEISKKKGVIFQWLRAFYILGDDLQNRSIFTRILEMEKEGKPTFPFTTGENKYDFIDIDILANQIVASVMQTEVTGIINCCTGNPISLKEKVEQFIFEKNLKIKPEYGVYPSRPYDSPAIWGDPTKITQILKNYNP